MLFYTKLFRKMTIYQNLIDFFIFCKKELPLLTLSYHIETIYNFCQEVSLTTYILNHTVNHGFKSPSFIVNNYQLEI